MTPIFLRKLSVAELRQFAFIANRASLGCETLGETRTAADLAQSAGDFDRLADAAAQAAVDRLVAREAAARRVTL